MKLSAVLRLSAFLTLLACLPTARAAATDFATPPGKPGSPQYNEWLGRALTRLQRLDDEDALRQLAVAYGRGNDEITIHHGDRPKGRALAIAEYSRSFAPEARIEVFALGGAAPIATAVGVPAWAEFVEKYYEGNRYSSTIHLMSNFRIEFTDADTAVVSNYAIAPHFILSAAREAAKAEPGVEIMHCRYTYEAKRQPDGGWKTVKLKIELQEIWRGLGFYPGGQGQGL